MTNELNSDLNMYTADIVNMKSTWNTKDSPCGDLKHCPLFTECGIIHDTSTFCNNSALQNAKIPLKTLSSDLFIQVELNQQTKWLIQTTQKIEEWKPIRWQSVITKPV